MTRKWSARDVAVQILGRVERGASHASNAIDEVLSTTSGLPEVDKRLVTELVYGTLRHRRRLDRALQSASRRSLRSTHPLVLRLLRLATYQMLMLDRVPARAAVSHAVGAVRDKLGPRVGGYANGVLRTIARRGEPELPRRDEEPASYLRHALSYSDWMADLMEVRLGVEGAVELGSALNRRPELVVRANTLIATRQDLLSKLRAEGGVEAEPTSHSPEGVRVRGLADPVRHPLHQKGMLAIQEEGSQLITHLLEPRAGHRVFDACCGAGGKSLHIAGLTHDEADITAADISAKKIEEARQRAKLAGVEAVRWRQMDLADPGSMASLEGGYNRVLLDAPCSGLGALRRHPEAKWTWDGKKLGEIVEMQRLLLENVSKTVAPGGVLVYAVCTFTSEEGSEQVDRFLALHPEFHGEPVPDDENPVAALCSPSGKLELWPHEQDTDGFFAARMVRSHEPPK
jgi:16S rRNA (cytosine967-C5)-methyltransferase